MFSEEYRFTLQWSDATKNQIGKSGEQYKHAPHLKLLLIC